MSRRSITAVLWGSKGVASIRVGTSEIHLISAQSRWNRSNLTGKLPQLGRGNMTQAPDSWRRHSGCSDCFVAFTQRVQNSEFHKVPCSCVLCPQPHASYQSLTAAGAQAAPDRAAGMSGLCVEFHQREPVVLSLWE